MATVNLKDVLHLYIGCEIKTHPDFIPNRDAKTETKGVSILTPGLYCDLMYNTFPGSIGSTWQPIMRTLESITDEEAKQVCEACGWSGYKHNHREKVLFTTCKYEQAAVWVVELCKRGFDLFGLIPSGQAIDKDSIKKDG